MTLDQLRVFVSVAERLHMTQAAEALHLTQSAVSGAIRALEDRHGVKLFHRVGRNIDLTQDGRTFLEEARVILLGVRSAEQTLRELRGLRRGTISIHASQTTASYWLPKRLVAFKATYPEVTINLKIGNTTQVAAGVISGEAEIGFVEDAVCHAELVSQPVHKDNLIVIVNANHPWSTLRRSLKAKDLYSANWVLRERGSGTRAVFEQALRRNGVNPENLRVSLELPSNEAVRAAVEAGAGATALSHAVARTGLIARQITKVPFQPIERSFLALTYRERTRVTRCALSVKKCGPRANHQPLNALRVKRKYCVKSLRSKTSFRMSALSKNASLCHRRSYHRRSDVVDEGVQLRVRNMIADRPYAARPRKTIHCMTLMQYHLQLCCRSSP